MVTMAFGDTASAAMIQERSGVDIFAIAHLEKLERPSRPVPLCTATDLQTEAPMTGACDVWRDTFGPGCDNRKFCAELEFRPSIMSDPALRSVLERAIRNPCQALPTPAPDARPSALSATMFLGLTVDRRVLQRGRIGEVHGRIEPDSSQGDAMRIRF